MQTSLYGQYFLKRFDTLYLIPEQDMFGNWFVGYGHDITPEAASQLKASGGITEEQADVQFTKDLSYIEFRINSRLKGSLVGPKQNEFDAIVSISYNVGVSAIVSSGLMQLFYDARTNACADRFLE